MRIAPSVPSGSGEGNGSDVKGAMRNTKEVNEAIKGLPQERREQFTRGRRFIGPLPRPIGLLDDEVREGRRAWALSFPFLDPLYGRDIVSPFLVPSHLQNYYRGTWEH